MGTHRCLGNGLAETQTLLIIAAILHTAELEMHPPGYDLKMTNVPTPRPSKKFKFKVKRLRKPIGIGHPPPPVSAGPLRLERAGGLAGGDVPPSDDEVSARPPAHPRRPASGGALRRSGAGSLGRVSPSLSGTLDLPDWRDAKPAVEAYLQTLSGYRKNELPMDLADIARVGEQWRFAVEA